MSRRHKKKHPSVPSNPQPKQVNAQAAQELQTAATTVTADTDTDEHGNGSEDKQADAWYRRWYRKICEWFGWLDANRVIALMSVTLGVVGIGSLYLTKQSLDESRQALRPYVSLGRKDGVIAEFIPTDDPQTPAGIRLYMQNGGQSPALNPTISLELQSMMVTQRGAAHPNEPETPFQAKNDQFSYITRSGSGNFDSGNWSASPLGPVGSIPPQSVYIHDSPNRFDLDQLRLLRKGYRAAIFMGSLQYCDEFGNYTCKRFILSYGGGADDAFTEGPETDCGYSYSANINPGDHYLLPCEQPKEREEREKWERALLVKGAAEANARLSPVPISSPSPK